MFIAMKSVAVDIFFITVMKQSCCDYQDRSQYIFEKYDDVGYGERNPHQVCRVGKSHEVSFELLRRNLLCNENEKYIDIIRLL